MLPDSWLTKEEEEVQAAEARLLQGELESNKKLSNLQKE